MNTKFKNYKNKLKPNILIKELKLRPHLAFLGLLLVFGFVFAFYNFENRYFLEDDYSN